MSARLAMKGLGAGRLGLGLAMVAAPVVFGRPWIGDSAADAGGKVALRALGAREVLLGFMAVHVASADDPMIAARWSAAIALCDVVDGVASTGARKGLGPKGDAVIVLALGSAAAGFAIASGLRSS